MKRNHLRVGSANVSESDDIDEEAAEAQAGGVRETEVETETRARTGGVGSLFNRIVSESSSSLFWNGQSSQGGFLIRNTVKKSVSHGGSLDVTPRERDDDSMLPCVEAHNVEDELNDSSSLRALMGVGGSGGGPAGFGQAWHWFKERRRQTSVALRASLTCISIPWHRIVADVLDSSQEPLLTF